MKTKIGPNNNLRVALYEPDIPQNCGATMRLCSALQVGMDIIEPCGFLLDNRKLRRSGMDYINFLDQETYTSWDKFHETRKKSHRLVLLTTKTDQDYLDFEFKENDILIAGSEGAGVPDHVHDAVQERVTIKMHPQARSINVVNATSIILGEAIRQLKTK